MSEDLIKAEPRTEFGKGAARRIRRADKVPAVIYGHGNDPIHVTLPGHDTMLAIKHGGANAVLNIEIDGKVQLALTKQIQADPIKGFLEHIDFVAVRKGEKVTVEIPVHLVGEAVRTRSWSPSSNVRHRSRPRPPTSPSRSRSRSRAPRSAPRSSPPTSTCPRARPCSPTPRR